jgi:hypothetical protein
VLKRLTTDSKLLQSPHNSLATTPFGVAASPGLLSISPADEFARYIGQVAEQQLRTGAVNMATFGSLLLVGLLLVLQGHGAKLGVAPRGMYFVLVAS